MKIANRKALVAKGITVGLLAGAFALAAPDKAQAQSFVVLQAGYPHYDYARCDYYEHLRLERLRHEEWVRDHEYGRYYRYDYRRRW